MNQIDLTKKQSMVNTKTFIMGATVLMALLLFSATGYSREQKKKKNAKENTEVSKQDTYGELVKKAKVSEGMIKILTVGNDYYFEIADSLMGRDLLIVNKVSGVPYQLNDAGLNKGMEYDDKLIRFYKDKGMNKVWVTTYRPIVSVPDEDAISQSVKANYRESVIEYFPIEANGKDSTSVVIKVNKIFDGSEKSFNNLYSNISLPASVKKELSKIVSVKVFPENVVVKALMTTEVVDGGVAVPLTVETTTNVVLLPEVPMKPRFGDSRVGFFTTDHIYFNDEQQKVETREFVHRWRLEPKPEDVEKYKRGELVEPVKPIVYYIDPATPKQWREEIKAGVLDWQAAFEAAGFKNAIIAKDAPVNDKDFDLDDIRYSVITYAASQQANAMGPSVVDPRSGEIIEADVVWWHNVMTLLHSWMRVQTGAIDPTVRGNKLSDEHMASAIRFVSSHEVGHTFGLKHNMGASWAFPVDSLRSPSFTEKMGGTASSIMDYARFNYVAQPGDGVKEITPKIGVYDKHAINWAYRWIDVKTPQEELPILNGWVREHEGDRMYWYGEQQNPKDPIDPRAQDEDLGDDLVKANRYGIMNLKRIVPNIVSWTEEEGQDYSEAGKLLMAILNQWKMYAGHVTTNVGGFYIDNLVMGTPGDRYTPVPKAIQKESVKYLIDEVFIVPEWLFGAEVWKKSYPIRMGMEFSPYAVVRELQYATYYDLLKDDRLMRMFEAEVALGRANSYTPEEMLSDIHKVIFAGSIAGRNLSLYERMAQKNLIDAIIVSSNKAVEKTTKKALHKESNTCCFASRENSFQIEPREDVQLRNVFYSSMGRVSEAVSVKRGELVKVLKLAESKRNTGNVETQNHYEDLIIRIKEALNMK